MFSLLLGAKSRPLIDEMNRQGIMCRPIWVPLHRLPAFAKQVSAAHLSFAERLYEQGLSIPCSVGLPDADLTRVSDGLISALASFATPVAGG